MSNLKASIVSEVDSFQSLESEWNTLLERSNTESIFLTWEWLFTWWRKFHCGQALNIITIRDSSGALVGVGPFFISKKWGRCPIKALTFLGISPVSSEYLDIIADSDHEESVANVILSHLLLDDVAWDCLIFTDLLDDSCIYRYLKKFSLPNDVTFREELSQVCPYLRLELSREQVLKKFQSQLKSTINRKTKKLEKMGVELKIVENDKDLSVYIDKLFQLHQKCWNARGEKGNFADDLTRSFHVEATRALLSRDLLRLYALDLDGDTLAALYAFQYKGKVFYFQSGYDPEWSSLSPGTVLMWKCICDAIDRGAVEFDYLRGSEFYKGLWADESRNTYTIILIPSSSIKAKVCFLLVETKRLIKSFIKALFPVLN